MVIYFNVCTKLEVIVKDHYADFLTRQNTIFFIVAGSISIDFCFKLHNLTSETSNLLLPLGTEDTMYVPRILICLPVRVEQLQNIEIKQTEADL